MTEEKKDKKQLPLKKGLFQMPEDPNGKPCLTAQRCKECDTYFYSSRKNCLNCGAEPMEVVPLKGRGKVYTYTIAYQQLPGAFMKVPYGIAIVEMEEGVHQPGGRSRSGCRAFVLHRSRTLVACHIHQHIFRSLGLP